MLQTETESYTVYRAIIIGSINASFFLYPPFEQVNLGLCPGIFTRQFKVLKAPNFLHMLPVAAEQCQQTHHLIRWML